MKSLITGTIFSVLAATLTFSDIQSTQKIKEIEGIKVHSTAELIEMTSLYSKVEKINKCADSIDLEIKKYRNSAKDFK